MADSGAARQARYKRHRAGDHSMCLPGRCEAAADRPLVIAPPAGELDPVAELAELARRLVAAAEADPLNMAVARELRETLRVLPARRGLDPVERLPARVAAELAAHWAPGNVSPIR